MWHNGFLNYLITLYALDFWTNYYLLINAKYFQPFSRMQDFIFHFLNHYIYHLINHIFKPITFINFFLRFHLSLILIINQVTKLHFHNVLKFIHHYLY